MSNTQMCCEYITWNYRTTIQDYLKLKITYLRCISLYHYSCQHTTPCGHAEITYLNRSLSYIDKLLFCWITEWPLLYPSWNVYRLLTAINILHLFKGETNVFTIDILRYTLMKHFAKMSELHYSGKQGIWKLGYSIINFWWWDTIILKMEI